MCKFMKSLLLITFVFLFSFIVNAQNYKYEFEDKCGSPEVESQIYRQHFGKVLNIADDNTLKVKDKFGKKWTVELAGIDLTQNDDEIKRILTDKILDKNVEFSGNPEKGKSKYLEAIIRIGELEINRFLIEKGFSKFKNTDYGYSVSRYTLCAYNQLEEIAQKSKLGIWAK